MLKIYFTSEDIARTRVARAVDPLWELVQSLHILRGQLDSALSDWRRSTTERLGQIGDHAGLRLLLALTPSFGYFPDFLTPAAASDGIGAGLEAIRATPVRHLERDMSRLAARQRLPPVAHGLADGRVDTLTALTDTMHTYYETAIAPYRRVIDDAVDLDHSRRARAMTDGGVEGLLASLRPMAYWSTGELRVPVHVDQEIYLDGRGLLLVPSYFCRLNPQTMFDPELPPILVYPVARPMHDPLPPGRIPIDALGALIGETRAALLLAIGAGGTTTELARRAGVSLASASEHASVLRRAGLVVSYRDGNRVVHRLTRRGLTLLDG
jgi:DNA-binding transcriptional ArsR family regulator